MTHTGIFATSDEILVKAGADYNTDINEARINALCLQVEAEINSSARFNFSDVYSTLNDDTKGLLSEVASNLVALYIINYDIGSYASRIVAEDMINILRDGSLRVIKLLKDKKATDFIREVA